MNIVIKKMETDAEIKGKAYVHWKSWQEAYSGIVDQRYLDSLTLDKCEKIAFRRTDNVIIAKDGDSVIGFVGFGKYRNDELENAGEVFAIYILSQYYGKGMSVTARAVYRPHRRSRFTSILSGDSFPRRLEKWS